MPDYIATFTIHLTTTIKAKDEDAAAAKADKVFEAATAKIEAQLPKGIEWEADDYNPEITEC